LGPPVSHTCSNEIKNDRHLTIEWSQSYLLSENYNVFTTAQLKTVITFIQTMQPTHTLKTFDRWQHDECPFILSHPLRDLGK